MSNNDAVAKCHTNRPFFKAKCEPLLNARINYAVIPILRNKRFWSYLHRVFLVEVDVMGRTFLQSLDAGG